MLGLLTYFFVSALIYGGEKLMDLQKEATKSCENVHANNAYAGSPYHDWYTYDNKTSTCNYRNDWAFAGFLALSSAMLGLCFRSSATLLKHVWLKVIHADELSVQVSK